MTRCDICGLSFLRKHREVNAFGTLSICGVCFLTKKMLEKFEFATPYRGPMAVLKWEGFEVRLTQFPETLLDLLKAGCLGPNAKAEAQSLLDDLSGEF